MGRGTPIVMEMQVIPVAGYDSMLMTLSGTHVPFFTRNLVIITDSVDHTGIGETYGGDYTCLALRSCIPLVVGQSTGTHRAILDRIRKVSKRAREDDGEEIQSLDISKLKLVVKVEWAIECALLDLMGQYLDLPMCELLGNGKQQDKTETLGYLFYVSDKEKADLPYLDESFSNDEWFRLRRQEMMTPEQIVQQACALQEEYGFRNSELEGGVSRGDQEMEAIRALKKQFPEGGININPSGAWSLLEAIGFYKLMEGILSYIEDPCDPEEGFSSREITAEFKNAVHLPTATNMIATNWRQFHHATALKSVDIALADPRFWGMEDSVRMGQALQDWGLTWGSHSNNHFDIILATFAQVAAAIPGQPTTLNTHWIWQDGQNLLLNTPKARDGYLEVPQGPGSGVVLNTDRVVGANQLHNQMQSHDRDDTVSMQYLIPGRKYDSKKSCLVRE